eukprot:6506211-Prymnesium_polylepis.2
MDGVEDIILGTLLCHMKCKLVNLMLKVAHATKQHLRGYEDIPGLGDDREFCFRIDVKDDVPLNVLHGIAKVSISIPCLDRPTTRNILVHRFVFPTRRMDVIDSI